MTFFKKFLISTFILLFAISIHSFKAYASSGVDLSMFNVNTSIKEDGSIDVEEIITYNFKDNYNGAYRDISTIRTKGIKNLKVSLISHDGSEVPFKESSKVKNGDNGVFEILSKGTNLYGIKIYCPSKNEKRTFKITYTIKNVSVKYNDTGEFYYTYLSNYNETKVDNLKIHINLPENIDKQYIKAYYHGIANGECIIRNGNVDYFFHHVKSKELVQVRLLFPSKLIPLCKNVNNKNLLNTILSQEANYEKQKQQKIAHAIFVRNILNIISVVLCLLSLFLIFKTSKKLNKITDTSYSAYSPVEIPEDCTPAVAAYLVARTINGRTIYATILDLWRKGYLTIEKNILDAAKKKLNFLIIKNKEPDWLLLKHEKYFMHWIFDIMGSGQNVSTLEIKKHCKISSSHSNFANWLNLIKEEAKSRNYYDVEASKAGIFIIILAVVELIFSTISLMTEAHAGIFSLIISIFMIVYGSMCCCKKSAYGQSQYKKWMKFKSHVQNMDLEYNIGNATIETYIPYAEALNIKQNSMSKLRNSFKTPSDDDMGWLYYYLIFDSSTFDKDDTFSNNIYNSFNTGSSGNSIVSSDNSSGSSSDGAAGGGGAGGF
ncbi:DUF2207 domain-containing protein [Clostridium coskatii]|uniref:DUF2207 domain-containing protein n=1 Tax=Clostridium coskatii TaxID=1705578 RepID=A0A166TMG8_9CLOT|nr:DUF2207 domain-containing protein [Clostridium coskatii]OAA93870.1 hypothetical protein WX73_03780 [Clostridium coskatii]OBR95198.1 hypothetical protein CLCOS_15220 [Clostridium coskatii]